MATYHWSGFGNTTAWSDPGNWYENAAPGAADLAVFDTGVDSVISGPATVGAIVFAGTQQLAFTGAVIASGLAGQAYAVSVQNNEIVDFSAGSSLAAPSLAIGLGGGSATLGFSGASLATGTITLGADAPSVGFSSLDHGVWSDTRALTVGALGEGALSIGAGGFVFVGSTGRHAARGFVTLGAARDAQGSLDISGGGVLDATGNIAIGGRVGAPGHGIGQVTLGANGVLDALSGTLSVNAGSSVALASGYLNAFDFNIAGGALIEGSGRILASGTLQNDGEIRASGVLDLGAIITGAGTLSIGDGGTLLLDEPLYSQAAITFLGPNAALVLPQYPTLQAPIEGFSSTDTIAAAYVDHVHWNPQTAVLTLLTGTTAEGTLTFGGSMAGDVFSVHEVNSVGIITVHHR